MDPAAHSPPDHWKRIDELFYAALDLDPQARPAFLERACGTNVELLKEIQSLLEASEKTLGFAQKAVVQVAREQTLEPLPAGSRVGAYKLLRSIGEGGMGTVYLASRADELYQQQVAIKLMHRSFGFSQVMLLRFSAERQILADLNNPNIARLIDGGMTSDGLPYLVMEYVDGTRIDSYCRDNNLSLEDRLHIFRTVCSAVEYAHKHLVIHRDIKPANILVTADRVPKLLDFGIAKLLDPQATNQSLTRASERLMTPEYASPEQLRGGQITTAADVYALGVLLYELLAGKHPFEMQTKSPLEIAQLICEQEPEPPSRANTSSGNRPSAQASRRLKGDIDNIVLMAMRKEPSRRYTSAGALSADIQAYLTGYSVRARTDAWGYRTSKFVRRHKAAVSAGVLAVITLISFSIGMGLLAKRANRERRLADQQRLASQHEADILASIFDAVTPQAAKGNQVTARELLDQSANRIDTDLAATPDAQATALYNLGVAYRQIGLTDKAEPLLERAYNLRRGLFGEGNIEVASGASALAEVYRLQGQFAKAEALSREALQSAQKAPGDNTPVIAEIYARLGFTLYLDSRDSEAESALKKSLALDSNPGNHYVAFRQSELALVLDREGNVAGAWQMGSEAAKTLEELEGPNSPNVIGARNNLNVVLRDTGNLLEAEKVQRQILALWRKVSGDHVDVAWALNNLGLILLAEGHWKEAQPMLSEALAVRQEHLGAKNTLVAASLLQYGRVFQEKGDYAAAGTYFRQALDMLRETSGEQNWSVEEAFADFASLELDRGDYPGAESYASQALDLSRKLGGGQNPQAAAALTEVALARELHGDATDAEPLFREALQIYKQLLAPGHPAIVAAETRMGEALTAEGKPGIAEPILRDAVSSAHNEPFPLLAWQIAEPESALGVCLVEQGRASEAAPLLRNSGTAIQSYPERGLRRWILKLRSS
jgi:eukaryotic-like serine/threonine-protein kinase